MCCLENVTYEYAYHAGDVHARNRFEEMLKVIIGFERLRVLAERYTPYTHVSTALYKRMLEIVPQNKKAIVELGFIAWLDGEDDEARNYLQKAQAYFPNDIEVLTLQAALTQATRERTQLYRRILEEDPSNAVAIANLKDLSADVV